MTVNLVITDLQESLGISKDILAKAVDVSPRTVDRWCADDGSYPQREPRKRLDALLRLKEHLQKTFSNSEAIRLWMRSHNRYLAGMTPIEVLKAGRIDRVEAALTALNYGAFV